MVRRALAMAAGEQYLGLAISFALIAAVSRLLTPREIGVSVIGTGIMAVALALREFASTDWLIQREKVGRQDIQTACTLLVLLAALIMAAMFVLAPWFAAFYGEEGLAHFLRLAAFAGLIEALSLPITGLLRRDMAFGTLALINTTSATVAAVATVLLALSGFSYMSFPWAAVAGSTTKTALSFCIYPDLSILRPTYRSWRGVLTFGACNGASHLIDRIYGALPQLVLGLMLPYSAVGLYNRANVMATIPDKLINASVLSVAFPALAAEIHQGRSLKEHYLHALGYISVLYWPAQIWLALLAYPVVLLLLGGQWLGVAPLLQIIAVASLAWFPVVLTSPVLLAVGANRDRVLAELIGRSVAAVILCSAAGFGLMAVAASQLVNLPFQMLVTFHFVRRHVPFRWRELGAALWRSAIVTAGSAAGPICVVALSDAGFELSVAATVVAVLLAGLGWLTAVLLTRHPVSLELARTVERIAEASFVQRPRARITAPVRAGDRQGR